MAAFKGEDRRKAPRTDLVTDCPVAFECQGHYYSGHMIDLSTLGARIKLDGKADEAFLSEEGEIDYVVHTPYGKASFKGITQWVSRSEAELEWGVEFSQPSLDKLDKKDPLRCLIDSPF